MIHDNSAELDHELDARIWRGQASAIGTMPCTDEQTWAGSVRADLRQFGQTPDMSSVLPNFVPFLPCAALLLIKDEADIIGANLVWLYHIGVRRYVVMDNDSRDDTREEVMRFRAGHEGVELILIDDRNLAYLQSEKVTHMCREAKAAWPDVEWLLPIDADEFLNTRSSLLSLMFVPEEIDALTIPKAQHFQAPHVKPAPGASVLDRLPVRGKLFCFPPKVILRASEDVIVGPGNHKVESISGRRLRYGGGLHYGFFYREFQTRSFNQFLSKVRNGGAAILAARKMGRGAGGDHWLLWHKVLVEGGEAALRQDYEGLAFRELDGEHVMDPFPGAPRAYR